MTSTCTGPWLAVMRSLRAAYSSIVWWRSKWSGVTFRMSATSGANRSEVSN